MKKVVDANYLQDEKLAQWLSSSANNYVVFTDYAAMEAYKGNTLKSIFKSMEILARFPDQVLVLKNTQIVCGLKPERKGLRRRLVSETETKAFRKFCKNLKKAEEGDRTLQEALLYRGGEADRHMTFILHNAEIVNPTSWSQK
jgi:hypothetical protein